MGKNYKNLFFVSLSGVFLALALAFNYLEFLAFIALVPLFWTAGRMQNSSKKQRFLIGFLAGFIYFIFVFKWLWGTFPLDTLGIESRFAAFFIVLFLHTASALDMAVFWGFFTLFSLRRVKSRPSFSFKNKEVEDPRFVKDESGLSAVGIIGLALGFVFFEFIRSFAFGLLWAGPETLSGPHWTMGNLAYLLSSNKTFLFLSSFAGIYGISFIIISINLLLYNLFVLKKIKQIFIIALALAATFFVPSGLLSPQKEGQNEAVISVIQTRNKTNVAAPAKEELAQLNEQIELLKEAASLELQPQAVIFPEGSAFFKNISVFLSPPEVKNFFSKLFPKSALVIDNSRTVDENRTVKSRTWYLNSKEGIVGWYDKRLLTPVGEFLPFPLKWAGKISSPETIRTLEQMRFFSKGRGAPKPAELENIKIGVLICSGLFSPSFSRSLAGGGSNLIATQASTGIAKGSRSLVRQNLAIARMRAAENKKPLVLAANYGLSYFITSAGGVQKITPTDGPQILTAAVVLNSEKTLYNKVGDLPWVMAGFVALIFLTFFGKKHE